MALLDGTHYPDCNARERTNLATRKMAREFTAHANELVIGFNNFVDDLARHENLSEVTPDPNMAVCSLAGARNNNGRETSRGTDEFCNAAAKRAKLIINAKF
jgi:hypothetical protein